MQDYISEKLRGIKGVKGLMKKRRFVNGLLFSIAFVISVNSFLYGGEKLSKKQLKILKLVKEVALKYPNKNGETFEKTAMAICLLESGGGKYKIGDSKYKNKRKHLHKASLGIMQVRVDTARFVAKKFGLKDVLRMSRQRLAYKLLHDNRFNAKIAVLYLVWLNNQTSSYFKTISRYNGGNRNKKYYKKVIKNLRIVRKI